VLLHRDYLDWKIRGFVSGKNCCCQKEGLLNRGGGLRKKKGAWKEGEDLGWRRDLVSKGRF